MTARKSLIDRVTESKIDHLFIADHISFHTGLGMDGLINAATLAVLSLPFSADESNSPPAAR